MQRGIAPRGPMSAIMRNITAHAGKRPSLAKKLLQLPSNKVIANNPKNGTPTAVINSPNRPNAILSLASCPKTKGNTTLPAPKNIENIARPTGKRRSLLEKRCMFTRAPTFLLENNTIKNRFYATT